jgi:hypothetical protein
MLFSFAIAVDNEANFLFSWKRFAFDRLCAAVTVRHVLPSNWQWKPGRESLAPI